MVAQSYGIVIIEIVPIVVNKLAHLLAGNKCRHLWFMRVSQGGPSPRVLLYDQGRMKVKIECI